MKPIYKKLLIGLGIVFILFLIWADLAGRPPRITKQISHGRGESMLPAIQDGQEIETTYGNTPTENEIINLVCTNYKCAQKRELIPSNVPALTVDTVTAESISLVKRLKKINSDNCYWVEGDNAKESWDSRNFGWICPQDRQYIGIVKVQ